MTVSTLHGVATPYRYHASETNDLDGFEFNAGRFVNRWTLFRSWPGMGNPTFELGELQALIDRGTTPVVTWEPAQPELGLDQPTRTNCHVRAGVFDAFLDTWGGHFATLVKAPVGGVRPAGKGEMILRFAHEGNGNWYPWGEGVNTNLVGSYTQAFQRVVDRIRGAGATNVKFLWSINKQWSSSTTRALANFYPGAGYVDEVGLSGYCAPDRGGWMTFEQVFAATRTELAAFLPATLPVSIAETGCAQGVWGTGSWGSGEQAKPKFIESMWTYLNANPDALKSVIWMNYNFPDDGHDWRIESSSASKAAYRDGAVLTYPPRD